MQNPPGLELVKEAPSNQVLAELGARWPQPVHDAVAVHTILYGFVTCGGINYMQIALALTRVK